MPAAKDEPAKVDAHLARVPPNMRAALQKIRKQVRTLVPDATEGISYGMPAFKLDGRILLYYAAFKEHMSLFPVMDEDVRGYEKRFEGDKSGKGTLRFTVENPLPAAFVQRFVRSRAAAVRRRAQRPIKRTS